MPTDATLEETLPLKTAVQGPSRLQRFFWISIGILIVLVLGGIGVWMGYQAGIEQRVQKHTEQVTLKASTQFELGLVDLREKRYDMALARFKYVIELDPQFPGAAEKIAEVQVAMNIKATPTIALTATPIPPTPTPDIRGEEELFTQSQQLLTAKQWDKLLLTLDALRKKNLAYKPMEVDGMYYLALRNKGVYDILNLGNLEPGLYYLALAERFAPLDADAESYREYARLYITGASFWMIDWEQVVLFFGQIYPSLPNLRDSTSMTAQERYRVALLKLAEKDIAGGDPCTAQGLYEEALKVGADQSVMPTATKNAENCTASKNPTSPPPAVVTGTVTPTPTVTLTPGGAQTPLPSLTPTLPPAQPSSTFTPLPPTAEPTATPTPTTAPAGNSR